MAHYVRIPDGAELPPAYTTAPPEVVLEMLLLGSLAHEVVHTQRSEAEAKAKAADYGKRIAALQAAKESEVAALKARYEKETATIKAVLEEKAAAERGVLLLQQETALHQSRSEVRAVEGRLAELQERKAVAEADIQTQLQRALSVEREASERILAAKEAELRRVLAEKDAAEVDRRAIQVLLKEKVHALTEEMRRKPATSKEKGSLFEAAIDELVRSSWGAIEGFTIADYSARGHRGDRIVTLGDQTILVECKDYSDVVPKSEVDKFFKDVATNHAIQVGVMISRVTPIQGFSTRTAIDFVIQEGKLHIFVNEFDRLDSATTLALLLGWIRYWKQIQKPATEGEDKATAIRTIKELVERSTVAKRDLVAHLAHLDDFKAWSKRNAEDLNRQLQQALLTLQRGSSDSSRSNSSRSESKHTARAHNTVESSLFNPAEDAVWIERVQSVTQKGDSVRVGDLARAVAAATGVSVSVARARVEAVFQESALKKAAGFPTVVVGLALRPSESKLEGPV